jgi:ribosomal protein S18 acetylase RimI-like enzyme
METSERPTFQTEAGEEIYRYVERHGTAARHRVRTVTSVSPETFQDALEGLIDTIRNVTAEDTYVVAESIAEQLLYEDAVNRHNTAESRVFLVATVEDDAVGWAHLDLPQLDKLKSTAQLTVGVQGTFQGRGIGSRLVDRALEWAEANGYRKVYNSVPTTNDEALDFLENRGWETEGVRKDHYTIGDRYVDEVMLAYTF